MYSSTFRVCPPLRTDKPAPVNLYDEAAKVVACVEVNYVVSASSKTHFSSVPVVIQESDEDFESAVTACKYLNISLHQSQIVSSPGFVIVKKEENALSVISHDVTGQTIRAVKSRRPLLTHLQARNCERWW